MSRATTAVILSALVLPGAGQLYLKQYWRGCAFVAISLACVWVIAADLTRRALAVFEQIDLGAGAPDIAHIARLAVQASHGAGEGRIALATLLLALCWLASVVDAYRSSRPVPVFPA